MSLNPDPFLPTPARSWLEIDLEALRHNCRAAQCCLRDPAPGIIAVVKADGYGLGMIPVAQALSDLVRGFAVASLAEAVVLRTACADHPVYLLGPALPEEYAPIASSGFRPAVSTLKEARGFAAAAAQTGQPLPVQAVIDTGMGRIGALPSEAAALITFIHESPWLELDSVASHFPSADSDPAFTLAQTDQFGKIVSNLRDQGLPVPHTQLANSAGLTSFPLHPGAWARAGLMLYGISPVALEQHRLRSVVTWKTRLVLVRDLPAGHGISYGRTFITERPSRVATLPLGYADGFPRPASGQGAAVLVRGRPCPVLGRVTMDQVLIDVTDLPVPPGIGEEAVLVGKQGPAEITAAELAAQGGTISWDLLTGIGPRVRRCYSSFMF